MTRRIAALTRHALLQGSRVDMTEAELFPEQAPDTITKGQTSWPRPDEVSRIAAITDPVVRNLQITQAYYELSMETARRTGAGANWCTIATWASKQAGQSIRGEDVAAAFQRLLRETPEAEARAHAMLEAGAEVRGYQPRSLGGAIELLWGATNPAAAFERTSDAVARGNRKVFEEIGVEFARFLSVSPNGPPTDEELQGFLAALAPGEPPHGQGYLRRAYAHYTRAMRSPNIKERAELLLLANVEIGFHEQTRLQPEIVEAMNAPVIEPRVLRHRLIVELFPDPASRIRYWLRRLSRRARRLLQARDQFAEETQRLARLAVTLALMTLTLPGTQVLRLGHDLPDRFPDALDTVDHPELLAFLQQVDLTPNSPHRTGVTDWSDLSQRMHFIADLFRTYHLAPALFDPPFSPEQLNEIRAGRRPSGPL